jgi:hypothetical protein
MPARRCSLAAVGLALLAATGWADDKPEEKPVDLKVGQPAPVLEVLDDQGKGWKAGDHYGKKWVVL